MGKIRFIGGGSYRVFEVNNDLIFRFTHGGPIHLLKREKEVCELLQDYLSVPIPHYLYFSDTCPSFKGAVGDYTKLEGESLEDVSTFDTRKIAHQIGSLLSELHALELDFEPFDLEKARSELIAFFHQIKKSVFPVLNKREQQWTHVLLQDLSDNYWDFTPVFTHGDFDSSNILCNDKGVRGIIDFEEAGMGDPAWDFCSLLAEYGFQFLLTTLKGYTGKKDRTFLERIHLHAKRIIFNELLYGIQYNQPEYTQHGLTRLKRAVNKCDIIGG